MRNRFQNVQVYGLQDRRGSSRNKRGWVARWAVDGRQRSKSFATRVEADRFRSTLLASVRDGDVFDAATGLPMAWQPSAADMTVFEWARRWLGEQWVEWQPRTRASAVESVVKLVVLACDERSGCDEPDLRRYLVSALPPASGEPNPRWDRWLREHSLPLTAIDHQVTGEIDRALGLRLDGSPLAASTANRTRIVARARGQLR